MFVKFMHPDNGPDYDQEFAKDFLKVGKEYEVLYVTVHGWNSDVCLKKYPDRFFNSVLFSVKEEDSQELLETHYINTSPVPAEQIFSGVY